MAQRRAARAETARLLLAHRGSMPRIEATPAASAAYGYLCRKAVRAHGGGASYLCASV
jgi:hypothetical protein